ncbi:MAG: hypothetical protein P8126_01990 [Gammaproteobacteria bacterium]|jgi:hypothetical protein
MFKPQKILFNLVASLNTQSSSVEDDLIASKDISIEDCKTVCLMLGPYRNLTTLTAATLFLHPHCQVLNHARERVMGREEVDFLTSYDKSRLDRFIQYATYISGSGKRGRYGGSISYSHAFESKHKINEFFSKKDHALIKKKIVCLLWKESLAVSNLIRERKIDIEDILGREERLRFLMPIRNPMDCAISNKNRSLKKMFKGIDKNSQTEDILGVILDQIAWFVALKEKFPDRFFYYFEHSIDRKMLTDLAVFLKLSPDNNWLDNAVSAMTTKSSYQHKNQLFSFYRETVENRFSKYPEMAEQLLAFS